VSCQAAIAARRTRGGQSSQATSMRRCHRVRRTRTLDALTAARVLTVPWPRDVIVAAMSSNEIVHDGAERQDGGLL
jgi:hypothetical protein